MYLPVISDARLAAQYFVLPYYAAVYTDCKSEGSVQYTHVVMVMTLSPVSEAEPPNTKFMMAVAAEVNQYAQVVPGSGSHFLGVFTGGHMNLGASDDWADLGKFTVKALEIIVDKLKTQPPKVIPLGDD
ncbi:MAG: hypothetical protein H7Y09_06445 [Chitinophagaceae bacterium]|nr:hypothetical protein [Anaerolineae bacterium]